MGISPEELPDVCIRCVLHVFILQAHLIAYCICFFASLSKSPMSLHLLRIAYFDLQAHLIVYSSQIRA